MKGNDKILLAHGGGGSLMRRLIDEIILSRFDNPTLDSLGDAAVLPAPGKGKIAFTTDSYVVQPMFFPGGDVGRLAVCGTVNDLAASGAKPFWLTLALIIEEGLPVADLERAMDSAADAAREADVQIVAGDTKVVERGAADGLYINTSGIGRLTLSRKLSADDIRPGDKIIISGTIGDHGIAVVSRRAGIQFETTVSSDAAPLNGLVAAAIEAAGDGIRFMRDPTRGGVAAALNEMAVDASAAMILDESLVPVGDDVRAACDILGFDPLYIANEGKMIFICDADRSAALVDALRAHHYGKDAAVIGEVEAKPAGRALLRTAVGGARILDMPHGEQLPRIC